MSSARWSLTGQERGSGELISCSRVPPFIYWDMGKEKGSECQGFSRYSVSATCKTMDTQEAHNSQKGESVLEGSHLYTRLPCLSR